MSSPSRCKLIGLVILCVALTRAFGEFTYERLSQFQPLANQPCAFTLGADDHAYTVVSDNREGNVHRILRVDVGGRIETVVVFGAETELSNVRPWLVKGPDGLLYGCAYTLLPTPHRVIYRLTAAGQVEVIGSGNFILAPVFGGDGALYGCSELTGISRFRLTGEFETVPGTESVRPANGPLVSLVARVGGEVLFATPNMLWKIGADGVASGHVPFDAGSPVAATLGTNLHGTLVRGKSHVIYGMTRAGGPENRGAIFKISLNGKAEPVVAFGSLPGSLNGNSTSFNIVEGGVGDLFHVSTRHSAGRDVFAIRPGGTTEKIGVIPVTGNEIDPLVTGVDEEAYAVYCVGGQLGKRTVSKLSSLPGLTIAGESPEVRTLDGEQIRSQPTVGPDGGIWAIGSASIGSHVAHMVRLRPGLLFAERPLIGGDVLPGRNPTDLHALPDGSVAGIGGYADSSDSTIFQAFADGSVRYVDQVGQARFAPVQFSDGSLVGTTVRDGLSTVYRIAPDGSRSVVKLVTSGAGVPGNQAEGQLVRANNGAWYGLTRSGGAANAGTIIKVTESFEVRSVYELGYYPGAKTPVGSFVDGGDGLLYAAAVAGGKHGVGGLIRYTPNGAASLVASFTEPISPASLGSLYSPSPQIVRGNDGWFYGVTNYRNPAATNPQPGYGFVFRVNKSGSFQVLGRFTGEAGALPGDKPHSTLTAGADGAFYGVTEFGGAHNCGTVFRVAPDGVVQHLVSFSGTAGNHAGANPRAALVRRGNVLYGACAKGGAFGAGTLFRVDQSDRVTVVQTLTGVDGPAPGWAPHELVIGRDGQLYGTGGSNDLAGGHVTKNGINGTLFRLKFGQSATVVNDALEMPVIRADVLANDGFDFVAQAPTIVSLTQPALGLVTLNAGGTISYKPGAAFKGNDTFTYKAKQGANVLGTATVTIIDSRPPEILRLPWDSSLKAGGSGTAALPNYVKETVVRDASGPVTSEQTPPAGTLLSVGQHSVTLKFTDVAGNSSTQVLQIDVYDGTPPVIVTKPADRTIVRAPGEPPPLCPDLVSEVTATDNAGIQSITQSPLAGTPLPNGYTRFVILVSDGGREATYAGSIRVIPVADAVGTTGSIATGFDEEHRYVSFGLPAIAPDGTLAFKAGIKPLAGAAKTAIFRREPGASPAPVAVTGSTEAFTAFEEPLVNSAGTVVFTAKAKSPEGKLIEGIWVAKAGLPAELLARTGEPLPLAGSQEVFRDFVDVSLLESGAMFVHATVGVEPSRLRQRTLWLVENGTWRLLLRTGESPTLNGVASAIVDFSFGNVLPRVGAQTRSFNASGHVVSRLTLADKRSAIVRVSVAGPEVQIEPIVMAGADGAEWLALGIPAINDAGDIVFRGSYKTDGANTQAIGRLAAEESAVRIITSISMPPRAKVLDRLGDPIAMPNGNVAIPTRSATRNLELWFWRKTFVSGLYLERASDSVDDRTGEKRLQHFDSIAVSEAGVVSMGRYRQPRRGGFLRGIIHTDSENLLLQAERDLPPVSGDAPESIRRIDFLTPMLGVGGQTRGVNPSGQIAFRAKLSSGKTAIYVITP